MIASELRKQVHGGGGSERSGGTCGRTSSRAELLLLIDTTAMMHLPGAQNPGECQLNFAQGYHLYIARTRCRHGALHYGKLWRLECCKALSTA
jgi:hypothetical protein